MHSVPESFDKPLTTPQSEPGNLSLSHDEAFPRDCYS
jgi:hypothetical protein